MKKSSLSDSKAEIRLHGCKRCEDVHGDGAVLSEKFLHSKKPVTLAVPLIFPDSLDPTPEFLGALIREYIGLTGIVPFDWGYVWPVPERYQSTTESGGKLYGIWFGFDTMEEALAIKSKLDPIESHVDVWTETEEQNLRRYLERTEGNACPISKTGESSEAIYRSCRTQIPKGWSIH